MKVFVLAAGAGSRMRDLDMPKALLPYKGKAILDHIFDAWPEGSEFLIATPFEDTRIVSWYYVMYPNNERNVSFITVPERRKVEGPIGTLDHMLRHYRSSEPIGVTVADGVYGKVSVGSPPAKVTLFCGLEPVKTEDYLCVWPVSSYSTDITLYEKQDSVPDEYGVWSGVMVAHDVPALRNAIASVQKAAAEGYELSYEALFKALGPWSINCEELPFVDLGTLDKFLASLATNGSDYSKPDQVTYVGQDRVVKWFNSDETARNFCNRYLKLIEEGVAWLLPTDLRLVKQFVSYKKVNGTTIRSITPDQFKILLERLNTHLWGPRRVTEGLTTQHLFADKTRERVVKYLIEHTSKATIGQARWTDKLQAAFWTTAVPAKVCLVHGDLTLDNIVLEEGLNRFTLIDWRPLVSTEVTAYGDLHYDLAKLWVSIMIDIPMLKEKGLVNGLLPAPENSLQLQEVLFSFCKSIDVTYTDVVRYGVLLMAAMSGVHSDPLATALYDRSLELSRIVVS